MMLRSLFMIRTCVHSWNPIVRQFHLNKCLHQSTPRSFNLSKGKKKDRIDVGAVLLLFIPVTTFFLGTWQVSRRRQKLYLIQMLESRTKAMPVPLLENLDRLPSFEYYPIQVRGQFDHSREILIEPRTRLDEGATENRAAMRQTAGSQAYGAHVVTPFRVAGRQFDILVNRGFVPADKRDPSTRLAGQIEGEHEIIGLLRTTDHANNLWNKNEPEKNIWRNRDVPEMAAALNTAPIFLDQVKSNSVAGGPIGGQTNVQLRNEHLSYIITWYSLSAFTALMWLRKYVF